MNKLLVTTAVALAFVPAAAQAHGVKSIRAFCAQTNCVDGAQPWSAPVTDGNGNWYGAAGMGGGKNAGTIYRMTYAGGHWKYTRLYTFCAGKTCTDGSGPHGALVLDTAGNLYGTTTNGGKADKGTVFELSPNGGGWTFAKLHDFCAVKDCKDGATPYQVALAYQGQASGVPYDGKAPLFGTTSAGGNGGGTVFKMTVSKGVWSYANVYTFCTPDGCPEGGAPYTGVTIDGTGTMFGVTLGGGAYTSGAIYQLAPRGAKYVLTTLYSFCKDGGNCADGLEPVAVPTLDAQGNLYGSAFGGGAGTTAPQGTVWKLVPNGVHSRFTKLHDFCNDAACTDGANPWASLQIDADGHLLGTTYFGGDVNAGTVFKLAGTGLKAFFRLYSFGTADLPGGAPLGGLVPDGNTYLGTDALGGTNAQGEFYRFTP